MLFFRAMGKAKLFIFPKSEAQNVCNSQREFTFMLVEKLIGG